MYQSFFGLKDNPFNLAPNSRYLYLTPSHQDGVAQLLRGIDEREGLLVLIAEPGTGKTMLMHTLLEHLDAKVNTACLFYARLTFQDFLQYLLEDFGIETTVNTAEHYLTQFHRWLIEQQSKDSTTVIFIDEAQNLPLDLLANLSTLLDLEFAGERLVQIILSGQPALHETLQHPTLQQLRQRIAATCTLAPLSASETQAYIQHRFAVAGGDAHTVFSPRILKAIYNYTGGIQRLIHTLCDNALLTSYAVGEHQISLKTLQETAQDLGLHPSPHRTRKHRRLVVAAFAGLVVLGAALYFGPRVSFPSLAWSQVQAAAQHSYQAVITHTRNVVPEVVNFVKNLGGQRTSTPDVSQGSEPESVGAATPDPEPSRLSTVDIPERHVEREEIQAIVNP